MRNAFVHKVGVEKSRFNENSRRTADERGQKECDDVVRAEIKIRNCLNLSPQQVHVFRARAARRYRNKRCNITKQQQLVRTREL